MRHGWLAAAFLALARAAAAQETSTLSFAENHGGTYPRTITGDATLKIDLSALPADVAIHRAVFRPGRSESEAFGQRDLPVTITPAGQDRPLKLLAPRYSAFDVTEEVRDAVRSGGKTVSFTIVSFPGYQAPYNRLDVTCSAKSPRTLPQIKGLAARHRAGQTLLTWTEYDAIPRPETLTIDEFAAMRQRHVVNSRSVRYRLYRSAEPITAASVGRAELVDEVPPLTGWNGDLPGMVGGGANPPLRRYVVRDGADPVSSGTAVYAHNPKEAGKAYYAVSLALDGEEDLTHFDGGNALAEPVEESVGRGEPVLQREVHPAEFNYVRNPALHYYTRWESPPTANLPSSPIDYLVAVPSRKRDTFEDAQEKPAPVGLHLHCWGGNLDGGYGWWYDAAQGAILISTNQVPYDWWTGYHEAAGTWKSWRDGVVRDYTQARLMSFLDWATTRWKIDTTRVFTAGNSMGGSGSPSVALRRADRVAWCVSWVGVHRPAESPQFASSYERVYGRTEWNLLFQDRKTRAFEFYDDAAFVRLDPARETPLIVFANGKNDQAIGWEQAFEFWKALQETRRPHVFRWGQGGHGQRALLPGPNPGERELGIDVRLDRTLPAFTNCSLDDRPGDGKPETGDREGQSNLHLYWDAADGSVVDEVGKWSMVLRVQPKAPKSECTVDVTPRRCFQFRTPAGTKVTWVNLGAGNKEVQSGEVAADRWGLATIPGVQVTVDGNRLVLKVQK